MKSECNPKPIRWSNVIELYYDGDYRVVWGNYDKAPDRCLGARWNGRETPKYPPPVKNNYWYFVEPDFLTKNILSELLARVNKNQEFGDVQNILLALDEHSKQENK